MMERNPFKFYGYLSASYNVLIFPVSDLLPKCVIGQYAKVIVCRGTFGGGPVAAGPIVALMALR